jgi:hypothetical protein
VNYAEFLVISVGLVLNRGLTLGRSHLQLIIINFIRKPKNNKFIVARRYNPTES